MAQQWHNNGTTTYNKAQQAQQGTTIGATCAIFFWHDCHKAHILLLCVCEQPELRDFAGSGTTHHGGHRAAPDATIAPAAGRRLNRRNYTLNELRCLFEVVVELLPISGAEWEQVECTSRRSGMGMVILEFSLLYLLNQQGRSLSTSPRLRLLLPCSISSSEHQNQHQQHVSMVMIRILLEVFLHPLLSKLNVGSMMVARQCSKEFVGSRGPSAQLGINTNGITVKKIVSDGGVKKWVSCVLCVVTIAIVVMKAAMKTIYD
eukprot:scaffold14205_cov64-Cyclotella_meneghiniana.AAC.2